MSKILKTICALFLLAGTTLSAQVNTQSPYSRFGLGELSQPGFAHNLSLGGTGIGLRASNRINYLNPASYSAIDTLSFLFDFGLNSTTTQYEDNTSNYRVSNYNIHNIAIGFGITKFWKSAIGIVPYSSVGYSIGESRFLSGSGLLDYTYTGTGGLNNLFIGNSVKFLKYFSAGLNLSYLFGYLDYSNRVDFPYESYAASTIIDNRLNIKDMTYNLGFQFHRTFKDKYSLVLGAVYDNETRLNTTQSLFQTTYYPGSTTTIGDSIILDPKYVVNSEDTAVTTILPRNLGLGFSFGIQNKLIFSGDYSTREWSKAFIPGKSDTLANSSSLNFGLEYTPDYQAVRGYFNKVHYRLGGYYSNNYLRIRGEQLRDYGISFGVGLPLRNTKSSFNIGFMGGQRGTLDKNLVKETYGMVNFGLTLHDFWFFKRKFD